MFNEAVLAGNANGQNIMLPFAAQEMLRINRFSVSTIFLTNINMSFEKQAPEMFCKKRCS